MHHDETVTETESIPHVMRNHQSRQTALMNETIGNRKHLLRSLRIEGCRMFIK